MADGERDPTGLLDVARRTIPPEPWAEGEKIPWHEPGFSQRMLAEHLSQAHDAASRRAERIDAHVRWIHGDLLAERPTRILDLGCGPGLYASRLARLGHQCVGIDFGPASIGYAMDEANRDGLACTYRLEDIRAAEYGDGFALVMLVFGELNVFRPEDAALILEKAFAALDDGGLLLLEPHTFDVVKRMGEAGPTWHAAESGLFADRPHLCLEESFWDAATRTATTRYVVVDAATARVTRHASTTQAYTDDEYRALLAERGFEEARFLPSLTGSEDGAHPGLFAIVARKGER